MKLKGFLIMFFLSVWVGGVSYDLKSWAGNEHIPTTTGLDLETVGFQIISLPELETHLYHRALSHFAKANIPWNPSQSSTGEKAVLQLTLKPEPLGDVCPGKFLYEPGMVLRDRVILGGRNGRRVIDNSTWSSQAPPHIVSKMTREKFESELDEFMEKFIVNYQLGLYAYSEFSPDPQEIPLEGDRTSSEIPISSDKKESSAHESLMGLDLSKVRFVAWAGKNSGKIGSRANQQFQEADLHFLSSPGSHSLKTLRLHLGSRSLEECPNKILYTASLLLTEPADIARNPKINTWVNTWRQRKVAIVESVSLEQLMGDQQAMIADFITSYQTANPEIVQ